MQWPLLDGAEGLIERPHDTKPHVGRQCRGLGGLPQLLDPAAQGCERALGQIEVAEIGKRVERRLRVTCATQCAGEIARNIAQLFTLGAEERSQQTQERAPAFHLPTKVVHGLGRGAIRVLDSSPGVSQNRKNLLLRKFGSVSRLRKASVEEIASTEGIGPKLAEEVDRFLQRH